MSTNENIRRANVDCRDERRDCWIVACVAAALFAAWIAVLLGMLEHMVASAEVMPSAAAHEAPLNSEATEPPSAAQ